MTHKSLPLVAGVWSTCNVTETSVDLVQ